MVHSPTPNRDMAVTRAKLQKIAAGMSLYLFFVLWPVTDWVRLTFADDANAFSASRMITALLCAMGFGVYAQWQMQRLVFKKKRSQ